MTDVLTSVGARLADRWIALLVLPGAIYVSAVVAGIRLGHRNAINSYRLSGDIRTLSMVPASSNAGTIVLVLIAVLALSGVSGLTASALGGLLERYWHSSEEQWWLANLAVWWRRSRWQRLERKVTQLVSQDLAGTAREDYKASPATALVLARRNRISVDLPKRTTWIGDRFLLVYTRIESAYSLDLQVAWASLWLSLGDQARSELVAARDAHGATARLGAGRSCISLWAPSGGPP